MNFAAYAADVDFKWPLLLWLLLVVPLAVAYYVRRRRRVATAWPGLEATTGPQGEDWLDRLSRRAPPILLALALVLFVLAVARPQLGLSLPAKNRTIMLALDVSGSMRAQDLKPDRLTAARNAAKGFIEQLPDDARIGLVSIAATASVAQSPTAKRDELFESLDRFQVQRGTALGSGIVIALATLLPEARIDAQRHISGFAPRFGPQPPEHKPVEPGSNGALAIVLVTDGQSNTGPDPIKMAKLAADHGVRVHTVGIGTTEGAVLSMKGVSMRVRLDEKTLKEVATLTQGEYFQAASVDEMKKVYRTLSSRLSVEKKRPVEVSGFLAGLAALLAAVAGLVAFSRDGRIL